MLISAHAEQHGVLKNLLKWINEMMQVWCNFKLIITNLLINNWLLADRKYNQFN